MDMVNQTIYDCIVVGSGPSGAQAAQTLVQGGMPVLMLDVGVAPGPEPDTGDQSFETIRHTDATQAKIWLGEKFEGISFGEIATGSQLTPSRKYIIEKVNELTPLLSDSFMAMESLARGGMGGAWGLGCCCFSDAELQKAGMSVAAMQEAYQTIANRIGISYTADDVQDYTLQQIATPQPAIDIDANATQILLRYEKKKATLNAVGFFAGKPALALLTQEKDGRQATTYNDLDFYNNTGASAYRPAITITALEKNPLFQYRQNWLVLSYEEKEEKVWVKAWNTATRETGTFICRKLLLACNVLGTARIVLRSANAYAQRLPLLCNPYVYVPCLQWARLGKRDAGKKTSTAQLALFHDPQRNNADVAMASLYGYSSLLLFRILQQVPLNVKDALVLMQYLAPAITIAGIHQPDTPGDLKYVELIKDNHTISGDVLQASYALTDTATQQVQQRDKLFLRALKQLGCQPLKKINPGYGASIHYAGTLPFSTAEKPFTLHPTGRLHEHRNVYVADGSGFGYLPAKGITFSLMAHAHCTALNVLKHD
jgi:hypothetical protein